MQCTTDEGVAAVFDSYPAAANQKLQAIRALILEAAKEEAVAQLQECLRWGEPAYICKGGSTVRLGWGAKRPDCVGVYFHCQSRLVDTFRELYRDQFCFEGNRAIIFTLDDKLPEEALKRCIALALTYHKRKNLPLLGT